jgi:biopolymer transport protein TolQ
LKKKSNRFEDIFEKADTLDETYIDAKKNNNHPLARVFLACMSEWKLNKISEISNNGEKKNSLKERLFGAMKVASNKSVEKLEFGLNFLAIVGSSAPFVGLFGTVWGIMNSFQGIAASKNTSLAVVAPGIAEALLATALGLFAAIPAVFFYNIFSSKINNFIERVENFSVSLLNILSRELDR